MQFTSPLISNITTAAKLAVADHLEQNPDEVLSFEVMHADPTGASEHYRVVFNQDAIVQTRWSPDGPAFCVAMRGSVVVEGQIAKFDPEGMEELVEFCVSTLDEQCAEH